MSATGAAPGIAAGSVGAPGAYRDVDRAARSEPGGRERSERSREERSRETERFASGRRARRLFGGCAFGAIASLALAIAVSRLAASADEALRELRVHEQRLERQALVLGTPEAAAILVALDEGRDALRVRLVETLDAARGGPGVHRLRHRLEAHGVADTENAATLRLALEGRLAHAAVLIDLLVAVENAVRPWPAVTRGCHVQRQERSGLLFDCAVDVLHWEKLRAPSLD